MPQEHESAVLGRHRDRTGDLQRYRSIGTPHMRLNGFPK